MLIVFAVAAVAVAPAPAAVAPQTAPAMTSPDWLRKPGANDLVRYFPAEAARKGVNGRATISCKVDVSGLLVDCSLLSEDPAGEGFGAAALAMSALFKMRPMTKDGVPIAGGTVRIPLRFELPVGQSLDVATTCYGFAAAEAERNPGSEQAWNAAIAWSARMARSLEPAKLKPSEFEAKLRVAREAAASLLDSDIAKAQRDQCAAAMPVGQSPPRRAPLQADTVVSANLTRPPPGDDPRLPTSIAESIALAKRCYVLSAADAEKPAATADTRSAYAIWRLIVDFLIAAEALRPSEFSGKVAIYAKPPVSPAERAELEKARGRCAVVVQQFQPSLQKLLAAIPKARP